MIRLGRHAPRNAAKNNIRHGINNARRNVVAFTVCAHGDAGEANGKDLQTIDEANEPDSRLPMKWPEKGCEGQFILRILWMPKQQQKCYHR